MIDKEKYLFTDEDFDTFGEEYNSLNTAEIRARRDVVKDKLLDLNTEMKDLIAEHKLNLHNHEKREHWTSLTIPCVFNRGRVDWLGVRYGRSKSEIANLNFWDGDKDEYNKLGFQKYACMQVNVAYTGVDVGIFHSVPHDGVDRSYVHQKIYEDEFADKLVEEISKIRFLGFKWRIDAIPVIENGVIVGYKSEEFDFDTNEPKDFIQFYKNYDLDGTYSSMLYHFPRWDERLTEDRILNETFKIIQLCYDLYTLVIWKNKLEINE